MRRAELAETLIALTSSVDQAHAAGLTVTELDIELPLEVTAVMRDGKAAFLASAPHSRWKAGVLPAVHYARLRVGVEEAPAGPEAGVEG